MYELKRNKVFWVDKKAVIDIRDYERNDAIKKGEDMLIHLFKEDKEVGKMVLTLDQLKDETLILRKEKVPSKIYPGQYYELLSYKWKQKPLTAKERKIKKAEQAWEKYNSLSDEEKTRFAGSY